LTPRLWIIVGSLQMGLAVILGAFAAHALKSVLDEYSTEVYKTGNFYHFIHSLALIMAGLLQQQFDVDLTFTGYSFLFGMVIFSGSLYLLALTGVKVLGAITPIGGFLFIFGWGWMAVQFYKSI
jgi:uncharacterized membrane protein YgdD (TMEM256/DUF423 family)|tara:strand:- start:1801 stop:2172 length:372 start_codon:yes stop_codon:yes gene_type:complete